MFMLVPVAYIRTAIQTRLVLGRKTITFIGLLNIFFSILYIGSGRSGKLQHQNSKSDDSKKDDLNVLFTKRAANDPDGTKKYKRESDYYRRESRDKDDLVGAAAMARRSRESEQSHRRSDEQQQPLPSISAAAAAAAAAAAKSRELDSDPWLEVGCVSMGPIIIESASALPIPEHCLHLVQHK